MDGSVRSERPLDMFWFLPTSGDGRYLGTTIGRRAADNRYMREIAVAADRLGYKGVLLPTGTGCEDAWITAASIVTHTEQLRFLVALRPGMTLPGEAARQASAFDRLSGGRLLLNVVCGGNPADLAGDGIHLDHDERYDQADEFLTVFRGVMSGETVTFSGRYLSVTKGRLMFPPVQAPYPPLYFGGSSLRAMTLAAEQTDMYLTWGEPPAAVAEKIGAMRALCASSGRKMRFGIRLHLIVRETDEAAWQAADRLISHLSDETIAKTQAFMAAATDSEGQRRMMALHGGRRDRLEVSPNLWAGVGLMRGGAGTALVGSPATVAARLTAYQALGIDTVIASGYPHLEEAFRVSELLFPVLGLDNVSDHGEGDNARIFGGGGAHDQAVLSAGEVAGARS